MSFSSPEREPSSHPVRFSLPHSAGLSRRDTVPGPEWMLTQPLPQGARKKARAGTHALSSSFQCVRADSVHPKMITGRYGHALPKSQDSPRPPEPHTAPSTPQGLRKRVLWSRSGADGASTWCQDLCWAFLLVESDNQPYKASSATLMLQMRRLSIREVAPISLVSHSLCMARPRFQTISV